MASHKLLLIDDDLRLFELLDEYLSTNDIAVTHAADGASGLRTLAAGAYDVVLLDIMMPGIDGLEVLRRLRARSQTPVIMLTAKGDATDRIVGLELGADDYITKPFNPRELLARLRAVLRRSQPGGSHDTRIAAGDVEIDVERRRVTCAGAPVELTAAEFDILTALVRRAGRVVTRQAILAAAGRADVFVGDRAVDVHISHLRHKLGENGATLIKTVRGVGYVMATG